MDAVVEGPFVQERDSGFTLIEVLVSITVMTIVMAAVSVTLNRSNAIISEQSGRQAANRLAVESMEKIQQMPGSAVAEQLPAIQDAAAVVVDGVPFQRTYTVTKCWQPAVGGPCSTNQTAGSISLIRATVAVAWRHRDCPSSLCTTSLSTLLSDAADEPMFNSDATTALPAVPPLIVKTPSCTIFFFFSMSGCNSGFNMQIQATGGSGAYTYDYKSVGLLSFLTPSVNALTGKVALSLLSILFLVPAWGVVSVKDAKTGKTVSSRSFIWFPVLF